MLCLTLDLCVAMKFLFKITTTFLLILPFAGSEDSQINLVLKHCTSFGNKQYVDKITTPRKPINRTTSLTSMDIYFRPTVVLNSPLYIQYIANKKFTTQYRPFMINLKSDLCDFLRIKNHPMYKILVDSNNRSESNMLDPCPLKGHRFIKPYYTQYSSLPRLMPTGMWRTDVIVTKPFDDQEVQIFSFHDYYEVTAKGIEEF